MFLLHSELLRRNALQVIFYCCASPLAQQLISPEGGTLQHFVPMELLLYHLNVAVSNVWA